MTWIMELAMYWIGGLGLLLAVWLLALEIRDNRTMRCRVCSADLDRRGGYHAGMHSGFCPACATRIMREVKK